MIYKYYMSTTNYQGARIPITIAVTGAVMISAALNSHWGKPGALRASAYSASLTVRVAAACEHCPISPRSWLM